MIDAHRGAFEYDWRTRFHQPVTVVGKSMPWGEAYRLTQMLALDPSSAVAAAVAGWDYPISREAMVTADLFDLLHQKAWAQAGGKGSRPKPYPRPWRTEKHRAKPDARLSQDEIIAALRSAGHTADIPFRP